MKCPGKVLRAPGHVLESLGRFSGISRRYEMVLSNQGRYNVDVTL